MFSILKIAKQSILTGNPYELWLSVSEEKND